MNIPLNSDQTMDEEAVSQLQTLRSIRLQLAVQQFADLDQTISELKDRGIMEPSEDHFFRARLRTALSQKIEMLQARMEAGNTVYPDEVHLFVDVCESVDQDPADA